MENKKCVSIIVPCFNEEKMLPIFIAKIKEILGEGGGLFQYNFELILIDDGSTDKTAFLIKQYVLDFSFIKYILFSRNFGKEAAMYAGLQNAKGEYIVIMDADLQDPPELLPEMLEILEKGEFDSVATRRVNRKGEPPIRSFFARMFYKIMNKMSKTEIIDGARDYRIMTRRFLNSLLELKEYNRFSKGLFGWVGYKTKWIEFENIERIAGESKWSFWKLLIYAVEGVVAFSSVPLVLSSICGIVFCGIAFLVQCVVFVRALIFGDPVSGWPSLVCIILFLGGVQLFCIGILGQYISKMYLETKKRPIYICKETNIDKLSESKEENFIGNRGFNLNESN